MDLSERLRLEIEELHACFEAWFRGAEGASLARCEAVLAPEFEIVSPDGRRRARGQLLEGLAHVGGVHAKDDPVWIEVHEVRLVSSRAGVHVASYEEWQREGDRPWRVRLSTAVLREAPDRPRGLEWVAVHETWRAPEA